MSLINDRIEAGRYFGIDHWGFIRHAALRLALFEFHEKTLPDTAKAERLAKRFRVGDALAFYASRPELWRSN